MIFDSSASNIILPFFDYSLLLVEIEAAVSSVKTSKYQIYVSSSCDSQYKYFSNITFKFKTNQ